MRVYKTVDTDHLPKVLTDHTPKDLHIAVTSMHRTLDNWRKSRSERELAWKAIDDILNMVHAREKKRSGEVDEALYQVENIQEVHQAAYSGESYTQKVEPKEADDAEIVRDKANVQSASCLVGIDTLVTGVMGNLFPIGQENVYLSQYDNISAGSINALEKMIRQYQNLVGFRQAAKEVLTAAAKYGTGVLLNEWVYEEKINWIPKQDSAVKGTYTKRVSPKINAAIPKSVPITNVYFDTQAANPNDGLIIRKKYMTGREISECVHYKDREQFEKMERPIIEAHYTEVDKLYSTSSLNFYTSITDVPTIHQRFEVYECWGDIEVAGRIHHNYVMEYVRVGKMDGKNGKKASPETFHVLRFEPNAGGSRSPYWILQPWTDGSSPYPKSPVEQALSHYKAKASLQIALKDLIVAAAATPYLADDSKLTHESKQKLMSEKITNETVLFVNPAQGTSLNSVFAKMEDRSAQQAPSLASLIDMMGKEAQDVMGSTDAMRGGAVPQYAKTGVVAQFQEGSKSRVFEISKTIEHQLMIPYVRQTIEHFDMQFSNSGGYILTPTGYLEIPPAMDFSQFIGQIVIRSSSYTANAQLQSANLIQTMQMVVNSNLAGLLGGGIIARLFKNLLFMLNVPNVEDIIPEAFLKEQLAEPISLMDRIRGFMRLSPIKTSGNSGGQEGVPLTDANANGIIQQ
jgi:hypothetical protein